MATEPSLTQPRPPSSGPPGPGSSFRQTERRTFARAEGVWYLRHASMLARWPALAEPWAQRLEANRLMRDARGEP